MEQRKGSTQIRKGKYLNRNVFEGCSELKSVYFLGDAPEMEEGAFIELPATFYYLPHHRLGRYGCGSSGRIAKASRAITEPLFKHT